MKVHYDKEVDAAYIHFSDKKTDNTIEIIDGVNLDVTDNDELVGIEILNASKKFPLETLFKYEFENYQV